MISETTKIACKEQLLIKKRFLEEWLANNPVTTDTSKNREEQAEIDERRIKANKNHEATRKTLDDVLSTLVKFETNTFGICIDCVEEISEDRLMAMPTASRCINCQSKVKIKVLGA